jgi:hypothetical protein
MSVTKTELTIFSSNLRAAQPLACALFESAISRGKVANAYLLSGRAADHKQMMARQLASHFNCDHIKDGSAASSCLALADKPAKADAAKSDAVRTGEGQPLPAGSCLNCQWIAKDSHPQAWLFLDGEGKSNKIPVEKVRLLTEELSKTSSYVRLVVVPHSDEVTFHRPAANALLKSIEEPPKDCLFLFFADSPDDVLATIVSRCQVVPMAKPLQLGYWMESSDTRQAIAPEVKAKLEAARSAFILAARRYAKAVPGANHGERTTAENLKITADGTELSRQLLDLSKELQEHMDEPQSLEQILDLVVAAELEVYREEACNSPSRCSYLSSVVDAAEKTKRQISAYVKPSNAIESFSFSLNELRHAYSGEPSLAKR